MTPPPPPALEPDVTLTSVFNVRVPSLAQDCSHEWLDVGHTIELWIRVETGDSQSVALSVVLAPRDEIVLEKILNFEGIMCACSILYHRIFVALTSFDFKVHFGFVPPLHRDSLCRFVHRSDDAGVAAEGHVLFTATRAGVHSMCVENRFSNAPMLVRLAVLDRPAIGDSAIAHHSRIAARIPTAATSELHEFHRAAASLSRRIEDIEFSQLLMRDREQQHRDSTSFFASALRCCLL